MSAGGLRAALGRLLSRRPRHPEMTWYVGERVLIAACDRATGRPEGSGLVFAGEVTALDGMYATVVAAGETGGRRRAFDFRASDGWDAYPGEVTPWRIFHRPGTWGEI